MERPSPGTVISSWLNAEDKSAAWLSRETGLSQAHISLVLAGKKRLSPESADTLAGLMNVDARLLLGISVPEAAE